MNVAVLMGLLIEGGTVVTMAQGRVIKDGGLVIEGSEIIDVGKVDELKLKYPRYERVYAKDGVIMPGLVNSHTHAAMSLLRGYADDLPLHEWLVKRIWPLESKLSGKDIYVGALLAALESVLGGVTLLNSMYHYRPGYNEAKAFAEIGLRCIVGHVCFSWRMEEDLKALQDLAKDWHGRLDGLIRVSVDPHSPYTVDPEYMKVLSFMKKDLSHKYGSPEAPVIWHIHVAETWDEMDKVREAFNINFKGGVVEYLDSLGVLGDDVLAAHCVYLTDRDMEIMARRGVKVSHNPVSNLKLAAGVSPAHRIIEAGVKVSLGTDSACSNNSLDIFETMKTAALIHKGFLKDPTVMPAEKVLKMATVDGAEALMWGREVGSIEVGKKADVIIVGFKKPHLTPIYSEVSHLVYAAKSSDVETVIINGRIVVENRELKTMKAEGILEAAAKTKEELLEKLEK